MRRSVDAPHGSSPRAPAYSHTSSCSFQGYQFVHILPPQCQAFVKIPRRSNEPHLSCWNPQPDRLEGTGLDAQPAVITAIHGEEGRVVPIDPYDGAHFANFGGLARAASLAAFNVNPEADIAGHSRFLENQDLIRLGGPLPC
jgi:hypothetical protein